jgi:hypothetical protein
MMFRRLQKLGEEKFRRIVDELERDKPVILVARLIQSEWEDCLDVEEHKLARELKRLHTAIRDELFRRSKESAQKNASVQTTPLVSSGHVALDLMVKLESDMAQRIALWEEVERERGGAMLPGLTTMMKHHVKLLVTIQKWRFNLGIDEYKLGTPAVKEDWDSKWQREQKVQNQICEASKDLDTLFKKLKVPEHVDISDITGGDHNHS